MRSLFGFLAFVAALLALALFFVVPAIVAPMVAAAVRDASPFGDQPLAVEVDVNAIGLIRGVVGEIRISGEDLTADGVEIGSLEIAVRDVGIGDHAFTDIKGGLGSVVVDLGGDGSLPVERIDLSGGSPEVRAKASFDRPGAVLFLERAFAEVGLEVTGIELTADGVSLVVFEQRVTVPLAVEGGALVVPDMLGAGPVELLVPGSDEPWRLDGVFISPIGMELIALVDPERLLEGE